MFGWWEWDKQSFFYVGIMGGLGDKNIGIHEKKISFNMWEKHPSIRYKA
jgi:hypothetical protein